MFISCQWTNTSYVTSHLTLHKSTSKFLDLPSCRIFINVGPQIFAELKIVISLYDNRGHGSFRLRAKSARFSVNLCVMTCFDVLDMLWRILLYLPCFDMFSLLCRVVQRALMVYLTCFDVLWHDFDMLWRDRRLSRAFMFFHILWRVTTCFPTVSRQKFTENLPHFARTPNCAHRI